MNTTVSKAGKEKAVRFLTTAKLTGDKWFPRVYVVGDSVYPFFEVAQRALEWEKHFYGNKDACILVMDIDTAWRIRYGTRVPKTEQSKIYKAQQL